MPILTDQERLGTTIGDGKYVLERVLGRGGMGTVFEGHHAWTGRQVAVKLLRHDMALDFDASHRFLQEARSATAIEHPNVVEVLDMGRHDESTVYMVFELLRGESLADRLDTRGTLDPMQAAMILLPVADALAEAHRQGIVHRDVKPENIFLEEDGMGYVRPKLLDFGIARISDRGSGVTRTGAVAGTPGYLSPEHAQGFRAGPVADVWSLGVVLFECLTGYCPFARDTIAESLLAIVSGEIPSVRALPQVPEAVADVLERTLVRDPAARLPDGAAFRDALAAAAEVEFVPSRSRSVPPRILVDSGEISLSSEDKVELRRSNPRMMAVPPRPTLTPLPARLGSAPPQAPPSGPVLDAHAEALQARRLKSEFVDTLDSVPPVTGTAPDAAPDTVPPAEGDGSEDKLDTVATPAAVSPPPPVARRRKAAVVVIPLLLLLVGVVALVYRAGPWGADTDVATGAAAETASGLPDPAPAMAEPSGAGVPGSQVGAAVAAAASDLDGAGSAGAGDGPGAGTVGSDGDGSGASGRASATAPSAREPGGRAGERASGASSDSVTNTPSPTAAPPATEPATVRSAPRRGRSAAGSRSDVQRGANGSLILD